MRILHITCDYAPLSKGGGVERYIHQLALQQQQLGQQVEVAALRADYEAMPYPVYTPNLRQLLRLIHKAGCLHLHGPRTPYTAMAGLFAILLRTPFLYTAHCFYESSTRMGRSKKYLWDQLVERLLFAMARRVIVLSDYWQAYLAVQRLPVRHSEVLPNGIDMQALAATPDTTIVLEGAPAILSVSRLDPIKRIEDIIRALAEPGMEQAHLHVVGQGPDAARLTEIAAQHQLQHRVTFHGFQTDATLATMAHAADIFVLASATEGMPTTVLEMLARKLPVVASDIPGHQTLAAALGWPKLYPLGDTAALAATLLATCAVPVTTDVHTQLARQFDWRPIATRMQPLYEAA